MPFVLLYRARGEPYPIDLVGLPSVSSYSRRLTTGPHELSREEMVAREAREGLRLSYITSVHGIVGPVSITNPFRNIPSLGWFQDVLYTLLEDKIAREIVRTSCIKKF